MSSVAGGGLDRGPLEIMLHSRQPAKLVATTGAARPAVQKMRHGGTVIPLSEALQMLGLLREAEPISYPIAATGR